MTMNPKMTDSLRGLVDELILASILFKSDAYKHTHWRMYPKGAQYLYSYLESRGGVFSETLFYGLQMILKKHFTGKVITQEAIDFGDRFLYKVFNNNYFNKDSWQYILDKYDGHLPIEIKAVKEGTLVPTGNVLVTMENTDPKCAWLTNFLETILLQVWYPITVATTSFKTKQLIKKWADLTSSEVSPYHLNDFGFRGVSSHESAGIGDSGHLVSFAGTDTLAGILYAMKYYGADVCGGSVAAAEHSTVTIFGKKYEREAYEQAMDEYPNGPLSLVSDSWDFENAINNIYGKQLKDKILARAAGAPLVARPDSGDPVEMTLKGLQGFWENFGGTVKDGFRILNPAVRIIYGDFIKYGMIDKIGEAMYKNNWAMENVIFGEGGGLLQQCDRDTHKFAFKAASAVVDGIKRDVYKDPITDSGKTSKKGRLKLIKYGSEFKTVCQTGYTEDDELQTVFRNGELLIDHQFEDIQTTSNLYL